MIVLLAMLVAVTANAISLDGLTGLYYQAGPNGSYIAQGKTEFIMDDENWIFFQPEKMYPLDSDYGFRFRIRSRDRRSSVYLEIPGEFPREGEFLGLRFPFNDPLPGFDWSMDGRGLNTLTASFNVREAVYDDDGNLARFAVDAIQYEETWDDLEIKPEDSYRFAIVQYRYNSMVPFSGVSSVPDGGPSLGLAVIGLVGLVWVIRKVKN